MELDTNTVENTTTVHRVIPIAGDFTASHGRALDPKITRMKNSASNSDSEREGIIVEFNGGKYPESKGRVQKAVIQFECDPNRTGLEGSETLEERDDEGTDEPSTQAGLQYKSYKLEDDAEVLRLTWYTKYGCENVARDEDSTGKASGGWGFFGWLFIM